MGFFDSIKKAVGGATDAAQKAIQQPEQQQQQAPPPQQQFQQQAPEPEPEETQEEEDAFDCAGFDPANDEDGFFEAVLHMESEGAGGGTDESRAQIQAKYGIRDRSHWQTVKDSCYQVLARKHGSFDVVSQKELNYRMGATQRMMQGNIAAKAASGEMNPVEGISLEQWAAFNASIVSGANKDDMLKGAGIDPARFERANTEWNARMARDTTFAITTIYGNAFQAASKGKYGDFAREANAARAANRELTMQPPMSFEQYWEIMLEQSYQCKGGKDAVAVLKSLDLSIVDWTDLSSFMGYHLYRTAQLKQKEYEAMFKRVEAKVAAKYPGVKADVDISF
jgi:hypothetical protein